MTHTYTIAGMTCAGCQAKVQGLLARVPAVDKVTVDLAQGTAQIEMHQHIPTGELQAALKDYPKYKLGEAAAAVHTVSAVHTAHVDGEGAPVSWVKTYKPILLVFAYILGGTLLIEGAAGGFLLMRWMAHFMAAFFLVFSFFKLLDLAAFADSYSSYDILAARWRVWGLLYPLVELGLGLLFLTGYDPVVTNATTLAIMGLSIVGVVRSVLERRKIRCACLGAVFNLPMSTITIIEDGLMIVMSAYSLIAAYSGF
jgi:copper chaperone CopZ